MHMGLSYNGGPAALLHKTVFYWHLVFECELRQPRKIIVPLHTSRSLYSHVLNSLDLYARTKLCTSNCLTISSAWQSTLQPTPLSMFIACPKYWIFHSNIVAFTFIARTGQNAALASNTIKKKEYNFWTAHFRNCSQIFLNVGDLKKLQTGVSYPTVSQFHISCTTNWCFISHSVAVSYFLHTKLVFHISQCRSFIFPAHSLKIHNIFWLNFSAKFGIAAILNLCISVRFHVRLRTGEYQDSRFVLKVST